MKILERRLIASLILLVLLSLTALGQQAETARLMHHEGVITSVAFNTDGQTLASGSLDGSIIFWNARTGQPIRRMERVSDFVYSVAFSPNGKILAAGCFGGLIEMYDAGTGQQLHTLQGPGADVETIAFSPDGKVLASGDDLGNIRLWDAASGAELSVFKTFLPVTSLAINRDNTILASAGGESFVRLWEMKSGKELPPLKDCARCVFHSVAFSPDGKTLASGSESLYDPASPPVQQKSAGPVHGPTSASHHAAREAEFMVTLWDVKTGQRRRLLKGHEYFIYSIAFSHDGKRLASGSYDRQVKLWNAETGALLKTFNGHKSPVQSVAFSPDGNLLASASGNYLESDHAIILWNVNTGESVRKLNDDSNESPTPRARIFGDPINGKETGAGGGMGVGPGRGGNTGGGIGPGTGQPSGTESIDYNRNFNAKEVTSKARIFSRPEPSYTEKARGNQISGTVIVRGVLGSNGQVRALRVIAPLPYGLTTSALAAARRIMFKPAVKDSHNVSQYIQIEYNFNLY